MKLSHNQLRVMADRTAGYAKSDFEFWVSEQGIAYLTVYHVVYCIDVDGAYFARRVKDGTLIYSERAR